MALLDFEYNAAELPQSESSFEPIPAGWYDAMISAADLKTTKAGTGKYIWLQFDVVGPTHQGRKVFGNLNIQNPNQKAEEIAHQQLGELMAAIGIGKVSDTDQLIGHNLSIKLGVRRDETYGDSNDVKSYKSLNSGNKPSPAPTQQQAPAPQAANTGSRPPWQRN